MCFHGNQHPSSIKHLFISLYSKYQYLMFICLPNMNAPVFPRLDDIHCNAPRKCWFLTNGIEKSLKIGGNVVQLVVIATAKEKLLNVGVIIGYKKDCQLTSFLAKMTEKWRGGVLCFKGIFCHLTVEILSSKFPHISMNW